MIARTLGVVDDIKASTSDADATANSTNSVPTERSSTIAVPSIATVPSHNVGIGIGIGAPVRTSEDLASEDSVRTRLDDDGDGHGCVSETGVGTHAHAHGPNQRPGQRQSPIQTRTEVETQTRTRTRLGMGMGMRVADQDGSDASPRAYYFAGEEDLRLAGEGVFSPAVSMPPSPVTPRMPLHTFAESDSGSAHGSEVEGIVSRRRVRDDKPDDT